MAKAKGRPKGRSKAKAKTKAKAKSRSKSKVASDPSTSPEVVGLDSEVESSSKEEVDLASEVDSPSDEELARAPAPRHPAPMVAARSDKCNGDQEASQEVNGDGPSEPKLLLSLHAHGLMGRNGKAVPFPVTSACMVASGDQIATCGEDGTVRLWDSIKGKQLLEFAAHRGGALFVASFVGGKQQRLLTSGRDGQAKAWEIDDDGLNARLVAQLEGHGSPVIAGLIYPLGTKVVTLGLDGRKCIWLLPDERLLHASASGKPLTALAMSRFGSHIAVASKYGSIEWYNSTTGELLKSFGDHEGPVNALAVFPDGSQVLTAGEDGCAVIWDTASGSVSARLQSLTSALLCAAISPCGRWVFTGSEDGLARISDAADGRTLFRWQMGEVGEDTDTRCIQACCIFPDGQKVVLAGAFGMTVWRLPKSLAGGPREVTLD
eukprot:gb/GFBE01029384.1/.p1 GENE.gb/GFBE01029384.1/~~gb/GFBE01029384.1/.p1  ORF type:complete len:434 (+),score=78.76 gb/GFBE01029384.1/:1-1302(+)